MKKKEESGKPKIKPQRYWQWRHSIAEMKINEIQAQLAEANAQILALKSEMLKKSAMSFQQFKEQSKQEYEKLKSQIEKEIGMSLNGCAIDDVTFEINKIE